MSIKRLLDERESNENVPEIDSETAQQSEDKLYSPGAQADRSTPRVLLKHAGKWSGVDLQDRLHEVYDLRSKTRF